MAISPDGRTALTGQDDLTVKLWGMTTRDVLQSWSGHSAPATSVAFLPDGRTAVSCSSRECLFWNVASAVGERVFTGPPQVGPRVAISPDGRTALFAGTSASGRRIRHWDVATAKELRTLDGHSGGVLGLAFLPDGMRALSAGGDKVLRLWDLSTGREFRVLRGHRSAVWALAVSPDGTAALSGSSDGSLWLWNLQAGTGREIRRGGARLTDVLSVCFSSDGHSALIGHREGWVSLWNLESETEEFRIRGHQDSVFNVAFLPDGHSAFSVSGDNKLVLWDLPTGKMVRKLTGPQRSGARGVALAPDGQSVFSGCHDGSIRQWSTQTGKQVQCLSTRAERIASLAFSRDGRILLAAGNDGIVSIWDFDFPDRYRELEARAASARDTLVSHPENAQALLTLGEWFAFREADSLAADYLEHARKAGSPIPGLLLGRCCWRLGRINRAQQEFQRALQASEAPVEYLQQCLQALSRVGSSATLPAPLKRAS